MALRRLTRHLTFRLLCLLLSTCFSRGTGTVQLVIADFTDTGAGETDKIIDLQSFQDAPRNILLAPNKKYWIRCESTASSEDGISWTKNGSTFDSAVTADSAPDGVSVEVESSHARRLIFNSFNSAYAGLYQCNFLNGMRQLQIGVRDPTMVLEFTSLVFTLGAPIKDYSSHAPLLSGNYPATAQLLWFKDGVLLPVVEAFPGLLVLDGSASEDQAGNYTAKLVDNGEVLVSETMTITINLLPDAELILETSSQVLVGEEIKLTCKDITGVPTSKVTWSKDGTVISDGMIEGINVTTVATNHSELVISDTQLSHSGRYKCTAANVAGSNFEEQLIEILLESPSKPLLVRNPPPSSSTYWAGSELALSCSGTVSSDDQYAEVVWKREDVVVDTDKRISIVNTNGSATSYTSTMTFSGLSSTSDAGKYTCEVRARNGPYYSLPVSSDPVSVDVEVPTLVVSVVAQPNEVLDVEPYNQVVVNCNATAPSDLLPNVIYEWLINNHPLTSDQTGVTENGPGSLEILADTAGSFTYSCTGRLELFGGDPNVSHSAETSIKVIGPAKPYVPINVRPGNIEYNRADIQFDVGRIRYTQETYHVLYGTSQGELLMRTESINGNPDLTTVDEPFTISLLYLDYGTTYYYKIVAENEYLSSETSVHSFSTRPVGLLQVKAGSFRGCSNGKVLDEPAVSDFMRTTLASVVEESCQCGFPASNLVNGTLLCSDIDSHDLIYRAFIVSTSQLSSPQVISYIDTWIREGPEVLSGVAIVTFDANCTTNISTMRDPICNATLEAVEPITGSSLDLLGSDGIVIMVVVIAVIIFLILTVAILSITVYVQQKKLKQSVRRRIYASIKRESGASSVNGWHGEAHVTNKCPVYAMGYNVTHHEGIDTPVTLRPPMPEPPMPTNTPGIYDSIDYLSTARKENLRERMAMARPPLPPGNHGEEDCFSATSSNPCDDEENTGSSHV